MSEKLPRVTVYTDGACIGNPGPGGYGVVILEEDGRRELSGGFARTTNNRMEVLAAIEGLRALERPSLVALYSDSRYLVDAMTLGWVQSWRSRGWKKADKTPALNVDLWKRLLVECERHQVKFIWVEGHAGVRENERCDLLSVEAAKQKGNPVDVEYVGKGQLQKGLF